MTPAQRRAFGKLTNKWQCAFDLQERLPTLNALVRQGFAEERPHYGNYLGRAFSPRTFHEYRRNVQGESK